MKIMALFLGYELSILVATLFGGFKFGELLKERHTEQWAAISGMKLSDVFVEGPSVEQFRAVFGNRCAVTR
jgi:hypothetical protein